MGVGIGPSLVEGQLLEGSKAAIGGGCIKRTEQIKGVGNGDWKVNKTDIGGSRHFVYSAGNGDGLDASI